MTSTNFEKCSAGAERLAIDEVLVVQRDYVVLFVTSTSVLIQRRHGCSWVQISKKRQKRVRRRKTLRVRVREGRPFGTCARENSNVNAISAVTGNVNVKRERRSDSPIALVHQQGKVLIRHGLADVPSRLVQSLVCSLEITLGTRELLLDCDRRPNPSRT
jgi:hypothetical protein